MDVSSDSSWPVWSHTCGLDDLVAPYVIDDQVAERLTTGEGWSRRWSAVWKCTDADVICSVRELSSVPTAVTVPVRRFVWRAGQRHRPGLKYMLGTERMHGFESLAERRLLLALDFVGAVGEVLSQPFRLRFLSKDGKGEHIPDFLLLSGGGGWLLDVRPRHLVKERDVLKFAAARQAAEAVGWRYSVVTGWRREVMTGVETLSARRRPLSDPMALHSQVRQCVKKRPHRLLELVEATTVPAVARVHVVHLLWHRLLAVDLARPLGDGSWIYPAGRA
ncbi:TnsA-like heteromeric transposase endonuclease subunit [Streptomyces sp. NPDC102384]|uniref:TnsA-like heteromeric transposase endonuclease subunit n=1 Tax=unclassified Streptomyces TaxID=2593676 RepID=UPI0038031AA3